MECIGTKWSKMELRAIKENEIAGNEEMIMKVK